MHALRIHRLLPTVLALATGVTAQEQDGQEQDGQQQDGHAPERRFAVPDPPVEHFRKLPILQQVRIVSAVRRAVAAIGDPQIAASIRRIESLAAGIERKGLPGDEGIPFHDPATWCPDVAPARTVAAPDDPRHRRVRSRIAAIRPTGSLRRSVRYDRARNRIVRTAKPGWDDAFVNLWNGWAPDSDLAIAALERRIDDDLADPGLLRLGAWFEHAYADRNGLVFEGVTLYEAWASGTVVEVPDVDAVPWAHRVMGDRSVRSPIDTAGQKRIYASIARGLTRWQEYRTLATALALATVRAGAPALDAPVIEAPAIDAPAIDGRELPSDESDPDLTLHRLLPRMHWLWVDSGDRFEVLASRLRSPPDRSAIVARVDDTVRGDPVEMAARDARAALLLKMQRMVHEATRAAFEEAVGH